MANLPPILSPPELIELDFNEFKEICNWFPDSYISRMLLKDIPQRVRFGNCRIWIYRDQNRELIGFGTIDVSEAYLDFTGGRPHLYIPLLAVKPGMDGRGYGKAIVQHLIEQAAIRSSAPGESLEFLFLDVYEDNGKAIELYKKCGFKNMRNEPTPDPDEGGKRYFIMAMRVSAMPSGDPTPAAKWPWWRRWYASVLHAIRRAIHMQLTEQISAFGGDLVSLQHTAPITAPFTTRCRVPPGRRWVCYPCAIGSPASGLLRSFGPGKLDESGDGKAGVSAGLARRVRHSDLAWSKCRVSMRGKPGMTYFIRRLGLAVAMLAVVLDWDTPPARGDLIPTLYSTGVNDDGTLAAVPSVDQHYQIISSPNLTTTTAYVATNASDFYPADGPNS
jgi:ribosomal protein S18 acetylase RimI-like enzyme